MYDYALTLLARSCSTHRHHRCCARNTKYEPLRVQSQRHYAAQWSLRGSLSPFYLWTQKLVAARDRFPWCRPEATRLGRSSLLTASQFEGTADTSRRTRNPQFMAIASTFSIFDIIVTCYLSQQVEKNGGKMFRGETPSDNLTSPTICREDILQLFYPCFILILNVPYHL